MGEMFCGGGVLWGRCFVGEVFCGGGVSWGRCFVQGCFLRDVYCPEVFFPGSVFSCHQIMHFRRTLSAYFYVF